MVALDHHLHSTWFGEHIDLRQAEENVEGGRVSKRKPKPYRKTKVAKCHEGVFHAMYPPKPEKPWVLVEPYYDRIGIVMHITEAKQAQRLIKLLEDTFEL